MNDIIQLKITLRGSKPPIWRRLLVDKKTTFKQLHEIIQTAMGWENYHLYAFNVENDVFTDVSNSDFGKDDSKVKLDKKLIKINQKFTYDYDFGDNWEHQILVEKFLPRDEQITYPICIAGKLNCPPEDCGGIYGFYYLLEAISDKEHPEHEEMSEYLEEDYDPKYFDKDEINKELLSLGIHTEIK